MRAVRTVEVAEHEARSAALEARAINQAAHGHAGRAMALEAKSRQQHREAVVDATVMRPKPPVGAAVVAAEVAAVTHPRPVVVPVVAPAPVGKAVVAAEVNAARRTAAVTTGVAVREAEMAAMARRGPAMAPYGAYPAAANPYGAYPPGAPGAYPPGAYPPGAYPPGQYPPGGAYGAPPPGGAYPGYPPV